MQIHNPKPPKTRKYNFFFGGEGEKKSPKILCESKVHKKDGQSIIRSLVYNKAKILPNIPNGCYIDWDSSIKSATNYVVTNCHQIPAHESAADHYNQKFEQQRKPSPKNPKP